MSFHKIGSCPHCGAPLWIPAVMPLQHPLPPPTFYSCSCKEDILAINALKLIIKEMESKLAGMEQKAIPKKKEVLGD